MAEVLRNLEGNSVQHCLNLSGKLFRVGKNIVIFQKTDHRHKKKKEKTIERILLQKSLAEKII